MGDPRTATTWTLNLLREWGLEPTVLRERRTAELLTDNSRWDFNNLPYWSGEVDCCINAWTVANGVWLGADITSIVNWFLEHRLPDGGWNCEWVEGSRVDRPITQGSTPSRDCSPTTPRPAAATPHGRPDNPAGILLQRGLFRRLSTSDRWPLGWTNSSIPFARPTASQCSRVFPPGLAARRVARDPRMTDAIELIRAAKRPDGTWLQAGRHADAWFEVDVPAGEPSKWLTLFATGYSPGGKPGPIGQTVAITDEIWPRILRIYTRVGSEFPWHPAHPTSWGLRSRLTPTLPNLSHEPLHFLRRRVEDHSSRAEKLLEVLDATSVRSFGQLPGLGQFPFPAHRLSWRSVYGLRLARSPSSSFTRSTARMSVSRGGQFLGQVGRGR